MRRTCAQNFGTELRFEVDAENSRFTQLRAEPVNRASFQPIARDE